MSQGNIIIMTIMMVMVMLFPLSFINYGRGVRVMDAYLGGANVHSSVRFLRLGQRGAGRDHQQLLPARRCSAKPGCARWGVRRQRGAAGPDGHAAAVWLSYEPLDSHCSIYLVAAPLARRPAGGLGPAHLGAHAIAPGPPILQPFYDVLKLWQKENLVVRRSQNFYIFFFLLLVIFTGALFFAGSDLLLVIFALTLAAIFFVLGAYKASSPYSFIGAERELIQMMAYEPMVLLTAIGMYMVTKSFYVHEIASHPTLLVLALPGVFLGFLYTLEIKFRKSPVRPFLLAPRAPGAGARASPPSSPGRALALIEIAHWYENVFLLGWVYLFFASSPVLGVAVSLLVFVLRHPGGQRVRPAQMADRPAERLGGGGGAGLRQYPGAFAGCASRRGDRANHASGFKANLPGSSTTTPRAATGATSRCWPA